MKDNVAISVIIPVYNAVKYLSQCLDSVLGQTVGDMEVICVNDGRTDGSGAVLKEYAAKDSRIKVFTQENKGEYVARNFGLAIATGEWIAFVDADDWIEPDAFETLLLAKKKALADVDIVIASYFVNYNNGKEEITKRYPEDQYWDCERIRIEQRKFLCKGIKAYKPYVFIGAPWGRLYRRSMILGNNLTFTPNAPIGLDGIFNMYAYEYSRGILYLRRPILHYRILDTSVVHKKYKSIEQLIQFERGEIAEIQKFADRYKKDDTIFHKGVGNRIYRWLFKFLTNFYFHPDYIKEHGYFSARKKAAAVIRREYIDS